MPTVFKYDKGIKFQRKSDKLTLIADPTSTSATVGCKAAFITHAHTDHSLAFPNEGIKVYSTEIAAQLYEKLTGRLPKNTQFMEFNQTKKIEDIDVKFIPAGHLLGASQILFYFDDFSVCYTGDISTDEMNTVPKATIPEDVDILMIEATYGTPDLYFETRERIKISLLKWIAENIQKKRIPILNIGHLGAAQEIISFLNEMLSIDIFCDQRTSDINQIYKNEGLGLKWEKFDPLNDSEFEGENSVVLLPRAAKQVPELMKNHKTIRGIITGQASRFAYSNFEQAFPFSMHASCNELLEYIKKVNPKKVYTLYGFDQKLAEVIRQHLKIFARPIKSAGKKMTLQEFM